ncbi:shikimate dehydrogenase [Geosporobacter ferrireducens]|uniref:Shikimate dehydrogenase (NADP(+)) n=1 Tax=Geosporobacter ferrireducens TaxID=1424294 RepID=A0A1D8GHX2_9FIRM|nr:shikimate dehydrogenase [Geosporobacter ferrireducens]AOT70497.1 shikimate dehydrogenase [Geosporobacter ferrireducens]MTI57151.1 shikimate dehydrogenase [Geosporobacter ferrireducens]
MQYCINGKTIPIGLLGYPIRHSRSPHMHNTAFQYLGLNYVYLAFEATEDSLAEAVKAMRVLDAAGFNVTMPNKQKVIPLLDEISPEAQLIGSVNTVRNDNGKLIGYNTDGRGYVKSLNEEGISIEGKKIVMVGAGGAARSVAIQLALDGAAELIIMNRSIEPAEEICNTIRANISNCKVEALELSNNILKQKLQEADMLINSTPLGMHPHEDKSIIPDPEMLHPKLIVSDLIYDPVKTKLLEMAEQVGCKTINGLGMMIWQGALAFKIWTGVEMPTDYIKEIIFSNK